MKTILYTIFLLLPLVGWSTNIPEEIRPVEGIAPLPSISQKEIKSIFSKEDILSIPMRQDVLEVLPTKNISVASLEHAGSPTLFEPLAPSYTQAGENAKYIGSTYRIPLLEDNVYDVLNQQTLAAPPDDIGAFGPLMVKIGQGNNAAKAKKAKEIVDKALEVAKVVDILTGGNFETMPIIKKQTIGETEINIIFQSAKIHPTYAEVEVYVKIVMPRKEFEDTDGNAGSGGNSGGNGTPPADDMVELYFGATDLKFSQEKGIIAGAVGLLSDYSIRFGDSDKAGLWLKKFTQTAGEGTATPEDDQYSGTFISFDCNGFKEMGVAGRLMMSRDWVLPTDEFGIPLTVPNSSNEGLPNNANDNAPRVSADFDVIVQDFNDFLFGITISDPFVVTKWQKVSFELTNAWLDMSTYRNPAGIPYDVPQNVWEGVYIEQIAVTMPEPFKRNCSSFADAQQTTPPNGGTAGSGTDQEQQNTNYAAPQTCRMKVEANHLLIDDLGVTGNFQIVGQAPLVGGAVMDGEWGFSLNTIGVNLYQSDIVGFSCGGELGVPILAKDTPIDYTCNFDFNLKKYIFTAGLPANAPPRKMPVFNVASVELTAPTITVVACEDASEFEASVTFQTAVLKIGNPADQQTQPGGSIVKMPGLTVGNLTCRTRGPYVTAGSITINSGPDSKVSNFPVTVNGLTLATNPNNEEELKIGFTIGLNLTGENDGGVSATGSLDMLGEYIRDIDGTRSWKYKDLIFNGATVTVNVPQFYAYGTLSILRDDPVYGNGFSASLQAGIIGSNMTKPADGKYNLGMMAIFGNVGGYRYFLVDGFVGGLGVPIFGPVELDGFGGGVFHHMKPDKYVGTPDPANGPPPPGVSLSGIQYEPTQETKLGIKFSTAITTTGGTMDGLVTCIIRFDQNMALQNITFWGTADLAVPEKWTKAVTKLTENIDKVAKPLAEIKEDAKTKTEAAAGGNPDPNAAEPVDNSGIRANIGLSLDFESGFVFHAFAEVKINVGNNLLKGTGQLDLLVDPGNNQWHFYLGGYYPNDQGIAVQVPDFFNPEELITLSPVNAEINYGNFSVRANMYFLTGNTIPGPPPMAPEVAEFFANPDEPDNRGLLDCGGASPAAGTGIAFGASAFFNMDAVKKGLFGSCILGVKVHAEAGIGFDLALLKYDGNSSCSVSGDSPHGINGRRAFGRVFAFMGIESGHVTCIPLPPLGLGIMASFDVPNPSYFQFVGILKAGDDQLRFEFNAGDECGAPCANQVSLDN